MVSVDTSSVNIHSAGVAASCVIEFSSIDAAKAAYDNGKKITLGWSDCADEPEHTLKLVYDESDEINHLGKGLGVPYDIARKLVLPLAPTPEIMAQCSIQTDKPRGILNLLVGKRAYPLLQIREAEVVQGKFNFLS